MIKTFAVSGLERVINCYLQLDPGTLSRLQVLQGKFIQLSITDWNQSLYIAPGAEGVKLLQECSNPADTIIRGTGFGLLKVALAKGDSKALFKEGIEISGDTGLGEEIRDIFTHIDIDWETQLSHWIGDTMAHQFSLGIKKLFGIGKQTADTCRQNLQEFLQLESKQVPTQAAVAQFIHEVDILRHAVDRIEVRFNKLKEKRNFSQ